MPQLTHTTPGQEKPASVPAQVGTPGSPGAKATSAVQAPVYDNEDFVCFVRKNWGTPAIPPGKKDFIDRYTSVGGVVRNVRYQDAAQWLKRGTVLGYILPNDATVGEIEQATGRKQETPETIAEAVQMLTAETLEAILGPEVAQTLAREIMTRASTRTKERGA